MTNRSEEFKVSLTIRIDWSDLDYFGHVNNISFFRFIQSSRVNYWDRIGLRQSHLDTNVGPLLASCKCDFKRPLQYPGGVTIFSRVTAIGNTSFSILHRIFNDAGELAAEAQDVMVMFDFNKNEKVLFPEKPRISIQELEGRQF